MDCLERIEWLENAVAALVFPLAAQVNVKKLPHFPQEHVKDHNILAPAQKGDAGVDLYAAHDVVLAPGQRALVKTGIAIALPQGYEAQVRPRSGNALKRGLTVLNTPGTIDEGYRGDVGVILYNACPPITQQSVDMLIDSIDGSAESVNVQEMFDLAFSENTVRIQRGERIAQLVFAKFERPVIYLTDSLSDTVRGTNGFGSTEQKS